MNVVDVLIVADTQGALASGDLQANVYLVDTNKYFGSGAEGQAELKTTCLDGQILKWRVASISPSNDVEISKFTGQLVDKDICKPSKQGIEGDVYWEGRVETRGATGQYQYSVVLTMDGRAMTFDPFIVVKAA